MITENFKSALQSMGLSREQINTIENYLSKDKARVNADVIEYPDGSQYYSENYVREMMEREHQRGKNEGQRAPVIHKLEAMPLPENVG